MNRGSTYEKNVMQRDDIRVIKHGLKISVYAPDCESFATNELNVANYPIINAIVASYCSV